MRRILVLAILALFTLAACGSSSAGPVPTASASASPTASASASASTVGDTLHLNVDVTLVRFIDPAKVQEGWSPWTPGDRIVAAQWRITNTTATTYTDAPSTLTQILDAAGQQWPATTGGTPVEGCQLFGELSVKPGASVLGCTTYEVPGAAKLVAIQYGEAGEWLLPQK